jgi:hypothetical protein
MRSNGTEPSSSPVSLEDHRSEEKLYVTTC